MRNLLMFIFIVILGSCSIVETNEFETNAIDTAFTGTFTYNGYFTQTLYFNGTDIIEVYSSFLCTTVSQRLDIRIVLQDDRIIMNEVSLYSDISEERENCRYEWIDNNTLLFYRDGIHYSVDRIFYRSQS